MAQSERSSAIIFNMIPFVIALITFLFLAISQNLFLYSFFGMATMAISMIISKILCKPLNRGESEFIQQEYDESFKFQTIFFCFSLPYIFLTRALLATHPSVPLYICLYFTVVTLIATGWASRLAAKAISYRYPVFILSGLFVIPFIVSLFLAWR